MIARVGPKGQIVIPKVFRQEFGFFPGSEVKLVDTAEGLVLKREERDPIAIFRAVAQRAKEKGVDVSKIGFHEAYESELEERYNAVFGHKRVRKSRS